MGLRVPPIKNHYCKKTRIDFGTDNWQEDLDLWRGMPTTKQYWGKGNREVDEIQTTCIWNERPKFRLQDIRGSCRSWCIGWWYKGAYIKYVGGGAGGFYKFFKKSVVAQETIDLDTSRTSNFFRKYFMAPPINFSFWFKAYL